MRNIRRLFILTSFLAAWGQTVAPRGLPAKGKAADYEVSGDAGKLRIGVAYMGRSFAAASKDSFEKQKTELHDAGNFIVIEVGAFAGKTFTGELSAADFRLRLPDQKLELNAASPGLVANWLRNRDVDPQRRRLVYGGGMNGAEVTVGQPRPTPRFPGDPRPGQTQPVGTASNREVEVRDWDAAIESALVEGGLQSGRAGNLYFEYPGKMTKVKSLVLVYEGAGGKLELKLR